MDSTVLDFFVSMISGRARRISLPRSVRCHGLHTSSRMHKQLMPGISRITTNRLAIDGRGRRLPGIMQIK